ncbi:MAG: adenylate/guanylate cyclase domain-containing protein [Pseudomonadota bacterium]
MTGEEEAATLRAAERAGLKLAQKIRTIVLIPIFLFALLSVYLTQNPTGPIIIGFFLTLGLFHWWLIARGFDREWHRYGFVVADLALIAMVAILTPMSSSGDVPQIMIFRSFGIHPLFIVLGISALSLSPRFVLWTGAGCALTIAVIFGVILAGMERRVSWGDLPPRSTAEDYVAILLDRDFIGSGNRANEIMVMLGVAVLLAVAVGRARDMVRAHSAEERRRQRAETLFGRYVPAEVRDDLLSGGMALDAQSREASILFCDIAGFTSFSEGRPPDKVLAALDGFFDTVTEIVARNGGVVVSFAGDAVLAAFNVPLEMTDHAAKAVDAAAQICDAVGHESFDGNRFDIRVGVATGPVAAGSLGGSRRRTYTVYGDTVNLAQRLEQMNKDTGTRVLISASTRDALGQTDRALVPVGARAVKGRDELVDAYALGAGNPHAA